MPFEVSDKLFFLHERSLLTVQTVVVLAVVQLDAALGAALGVRRVRLIVLGVVAAAGHVSPSQI